MTSFKPRTIDIIILNYNGGTIVPLCLPSIVEAAKRSPINTKVIVLDNGSTVNSIEYIKKNFPDVNIVISKTNKVLFSYNDLIPKLKSDIIILLNNDIKVDPNFIMPLLEHFNDQTVFAVAPKQMNFNGVGYNGGKNKIEMIHGLIQAGQEMIGNNVDIMEKPGYTVFNANSAYDRNKFLELGGFDELFFPFTWEDTDLGYRAWKAGYKFVYEPKSIIYHNESYTFDKQGKKIRNRSIVSKRNSFLFTWKNITDPRLTLEHIFMLPFNLLSFLLYDRNRLIAFFEALSYLPNIRNIRNNCKPLSKKKDTEIVKI